MQRKHHPLQQAMGNWRRSAHLMQVIPGSGIIKVTEASFSNKLKEDIYEEQFCEKSLAIAGSFSHRIGRFRFCRRRTS